MKVATRYSPVQPLLPHWPEYNSFKMTLLVVVVSSLHVRKASTKSEIYVLGVL